MSQPVELPRWIDIGVLPLVNLAVALLVAGIVVAGIGLDPVEVITQLVKGAFGSRAGLSYTLYYATTFVFAGLAVAMAFHGGLFNIGGEGQAMVGGLGCALAALWLDKHLPAVLMLPLMVLAAAVFGAAWAAVPAALQAWRGSHVVITTIMFNFIASALLGYLVVNVRAFANSAHMPGFHQVLGWIGIDWPKTPLNLSVLLAVLAAVGVALLLWKTRAGYELRAVGFSPDAALYAGVRPKRQIMLSMAIAGALAGFIGINELAGVQHRMLMDFVFGAGFTGIAVSLIGRNHPVGIVLASLLFGALYQGGAELAFEVPGFTRDMVTTLQGLIVLFSGAMATVFARPLARLYGRLARGQAARVAAAGAAHG
jgi:ABC-type uncharacterized transport system permease subunit